MSSYNRVLRIGFLFSCLLGVVYLVVIVSYHHLLFVKLWDRHRDAYVSEKKVSNTLFYNRSSEDDNDEKVPKCSDFVKTINAQFLEFMLLSMYDPGDCSLFSASDASTRRIPGPWAGRDLWQQCRGRRRLCHGMPKVFRHHRMVQRYGVDVAASKRAYQELGSKCFNSQLAIFVCPILPNTGGGPRLVVNNLLSGLRLVGKVYHLNPHDLSQYDHMYSIDMQYEFLLYSFTEEDRPWRFYFGPIVAAYMKGSNENLHRITNASREHVHIVAASNFAAGLKTQYVPAYPMQPENVGIIATGVDTDMFKPNKTYLERQPPACLFYYKGGKYLKLAKQLESDAKRLNNTIIPITYGNYTEDYFIAVLQRVRFAVICGFTETQGLAILEVMAMDVPVFVMYHLSVQYFHDSVGMIYEPNKPDSVQKQFLTFHKHVMDGVYKPREWILHNFDLVSAAINTMKVLCRNERPFDKYMINKSPKDLSKSIPKVL